MSDKRLNLSIHNRLVQVIIILIGVGLIVSLSRDIVRLLRSGEELGLAEEKVIELEQERANLEQKKEYYQSEEFVEEIARNKLNMAKGGETIVILPENIRDILGYKDSQLPEFVPNWKQWLNLFFK